MKYFPWVTEKFYSPLNTVDALQRIYENAGPPMTLQTFFLVRDVDSFWGKISSNSFKIQFSTGNGNVLEITGKITKLFGQGFELKLICHYHLVFIIFWLHWLSGMSLFVALGYSGLIQVKDADSWAVLFPIAAIFFVYGYFVFKFNTALIRAKVRLTHLLELKQMGVA